ncbi:MULTISPECIES: DNA polymerase I [unclassified Nocardia]|uniref:DNA polymerase I n=1 Tax=unclassified Nocardia TaxID=2637762 RepID=UPI001CE467F7|nr:MULTISPECIES: DNA polymerase I [unclassified Nocardia]
MTENSPTQQTVLLVDAPALLAYAYRSVPLARATTTATGQPVNAISGFLTTLFDVHTMIGPTHLAAVFDGPGTNRRTEIVPGYRAHHIPPDLASQQPILRKLLHALTIPALEAPEGTEAGDLIASLSTRADAPVHILSSDDRILQCATDTVTIVRPAPGRAPDLLTPATIQARHGVPAATFVDYLALRGDRPRGVTPIPGVGDRTAAGWLAEAGTLDTLLNELDRPTRASQMLRPHAARVRAHRTVMRFDTELAGPGLNELTPTTLTAHDEMQQLFADLALPALATRARTVLGAPAPEPAPTVRIPADGLRGWLTEHATGRGRHSLALTSDKTGLRGAAITTATGATGHVDLSAATDPDRTALAEWLADPAVTKAVHDAKTTIRLLRREGWHLAGLDLDTALAGYLLAPGEGDYALPSLTARHLTGTAIAPAAAGTLFGADPGIDPEAAVAARQVARLADALTSELAQTGMTALHDRIELPVTAVLADIEHHGVAVDTGHFKNLREEFTAAAEHAAAAAAEILGRPINLSSTPQLQQALFTDLALPHTRRIKSGYSTAADELTRLHAATGHEFLTHLLDYRAATKLTSMIESLSKHIDPDGRIRTTLQQTKVETGRLSSTDPNLQNIPIRTDDGRRIREAFVPGPGFDLLLAADYRQLEMRIMAHASGDENLIAAFASGEDTHRSVAALAFGVPLTEVTAEQRTRAKAISYGLAYGQKERGLATELGISVAEAREHYDTYFARFARVRDYLDGLVERARRTGYTETFLGRRRYLPDLASDNLRLADAAERAALNAPIQGAAADIIKLAMIAINGRIAAEGLRAQMILQIHDELLFELPAEEQPALTAIVEQIMPTVAELSVPLDISVGTGPTWAQAH